MRISSKAIPPIVSISAAPGEELRLEIPLADGPVENVHLIVLREISAVHLSRIVETVNQKGGNSR